MFLEEDFCVDDVCVLMRFPTDEVGSSFLWGRGFFVEEEDAKKDPNPPDDDLLLI